MIALSAVQLTAQIFIHNVISFIDTFDNAWYNHVYWLIGTPYLSIIASNVLMTLTTLETLLTALNSFSLNQATDCVSVSAIVTLCIDWLIGM